MFTSGGEFAASGDCEGTATVGPACCGVLVTGTVDVSRGLTILGAALVGGAGMEETGEDAATGCEMTGALAMSVFAVSAGVLLLAGVFTMLTAVVFGFVAFGLVFVGMMCVLPGQVAHPTTEAAKAPAEYKQPLAANEKIRGAAGSHIHLPARVQFH